jgi:transcriptional regulator of acetoin/glycerol metabolism
MPISRRQPLDGARRLFHEQGTVPGHAVAESILRSWRRCTDQGQDMLGPRRPLLLTQAELRELRQRNEALRRLSRPAMNLLAREASRAGGLVILADTNGLVLETDGNAGFADRAAQVSLMPGAAWDEQAAGTNAIGTALVEQRPLVVHGGEHYLEPNRILTCAAVPIADPRGCIVGLLDFSGPAARGHGHALALVELAVDQIEHRMFAEGYAHCLRVRLHDDASVLGTVQEGLLAFEGEVLAAANRHALRLLSLDTSAIGVYRYGDLFADTPAEAAARGLLHRLHGASLHARVEPPQERASSHVVPSQARRPAAKSPAGDEAAPGRAHRHADALWLDAAMLADLARAVRVLDAGIAVLLQGETGSGKEVFARQLHARSRRAAGPFVAVNCAALPESLIESELFGYEEGAFTGARRQGSKGLLRQAEGGILFLDEIGDMPLALQARLLRVLQAREVVPLGGGRAVPVDFALVCATHRELDAESQDDVRADLYFRIAEYKVRLPALRERADRQVMVRALWESMRQGEGFLPLLPDDVAQLLAGHSWPGNFRQLVSTLRILRVLAEPLGRVRTDMLPAEIVGPPGPPAAAPSLKAHAEAVVRQALADCGGNVSDAARRLGVHRSTLYRWAKC